MYNSFHASILKVFKERGKKKVARKKRLVSAFMDFESRIGMD
jgi:hypothetical protein